jgi:hypothetical protein
LEIRDATERDLLDLAPNLRAADHREILASFGESPEEALLYSLRLSSTCKVGVDAEGIVGVFGCGPHPENKLVGVPWLMGTDRMALNVRWFMRTAKLWKTIFHLDFPHLWNLVDSRNTVHVRWLTHMGFTFSGERHIKGVIFREFYSSCAPSPQQSL